MGKRAGVEEVCVTLMVIDQIGVAQVLGSEGS